MNSPYATPVMIVVLCTVVTIWANALHLDLIDIKVELQRQAMLPVKPSGMYVWNDETQLWDRMRQPK